MTLPDLSEALDAAGVKLSLRLVVDAPAGALGPEVKAALAEHKPTIMVRLAREAEWEVLRQQRWGPGLTDPAPGIVR